MPFGLRTWVGQGNHVLDGSPWEGAILRGKGRPIVKYRDILRSYVQNRLNRSISHLGCGLGGAKGSTCSVVLARWCQCAQRHSAVSCAKTAEPIDLLLRLWTRWAEGSTNSIVFARLHQCTIIGRHIAATWRIRLNRPCAAAMRPYVKLFWSLVLLYFSYLVKEFQSKIRHTTLLLSSHYFLAHNFVKCWPIFKILSLSDLILNLQKTCC